MLCVAPGGDHRNLMSLIFKDESNLLTVSVAVESSVGQANDTNDVNQSTIEPAASLNLHQNFWIDHVPTFEPLKLCLDDSSTEGDEDMFDDDAFTFGDEDFQALMAHDSMRRMSIKSIPYRHERQCAAMSADINCISSCIPLQEEAEKTTIDASNASMDSSSGASSVSSQHGLMNLFVFYVLHTVTY